MEAKRKKELFYEYKNRHPEMGVLSLTCKATGEVFLGFSTDTKSGFNSIGAKLSFNNHPNRRLQALWNVYGMEGFDQSVAMILTYEDPDANHAAELEKLREQCLATTPLASKIWR